MSSTVKFDTWRNAAGETVYDGSRGALPVSRNLVYNGAMQVAQRGTSATGIGNGDSGYKTADRWQWLESGAPTFVVTNTIEADGPTGSGFTKSNKFEITTAQGSLAAADRMRVAQGLEGQDLQGLKKGTSSAESLTVSFWVKSNVTGTYIVTAWDLDNSRHISASYTVSSSGTWEKKTITFAGDTTGAFDNDNAASFYFVFYLAAGTDYTSGSLATSWASLTNANEAVGQTNLAATIGNYWQVTGVQLETGEVASPFEHKPFGVELAECQRYYRRFDSSAASFTTFFPGQCGTDVGNFVIEHEGMRAKPTITTPDVTKLAATNTSFAGQAGTAFSVNGARQSTNASLFGLNVASGLVAGNATILIANNNADAIIELSAEL